MVGLTAERALEVYRKAVDSWREVSIALAMCVVLALSVHGGWRNFGHGKSQLRPV